MDHIVALDSGANEIETLLKGTKSMIIRGADIQCVSRYSVSEGDVLYLVNNDNFKKVRAKATVSSVYFSYQLSSEESYEMIIRNQDKLTLPDSLFYKWAGKKYLVLIGLRDIESIHDFPFFINGFKGTEDWYTVPDRMQKAHIR